MSNLNVNNATETFIDYPTRNPMDNGDLFINVDISPQACNKFGFFSGSRVMTPRGKGSVVGVAKGELWIHLDGDKGASFWGNAKDYEGLLKEEIFIIDEDPIEDLFPKMQAAAREIKNNNYANVNTVPTYFNPTFDTNPTYPTFPSSSLRTSNSHENVQSGPKLEREEQLVFEINEVQYVPTEPPIVTVIYSKPSYTVDLCVPNRVKTVISKIAIHIIYDIQRQINTNTNVAIKTLLQFPSVLLKQKETHLQQMSKKHVFELIGQLQYPALPVFIPKPPEMIAIGDSTCDLDIHLPNCTKVRAHKFIVQKYCPRMNLTSSSLQVPTNQFKEILRWMYGLPIEIKAINAMDILRFAAENRVNDLFAFAANYWIRAVTKTTMAEVFSICYEHDSVLALKCLTVLQNNYKHMASFFDFYTPANLPIVLHDMIASNIEDDFVEYASKIFASLTTMYSLYKEVKIIEKWATEQSMLEEVDPDDVERYQQLLEKQKREAMEVPFNTHVGILKSFREKLFDTAKQVNQLLEKILAGGEEEDDHYLDDE